MPKKTPPHLPPPHSSLKNHRLWQRLKFLFFITFFSLLVGMTGAAMVLGWIWPTFGGSDVWITSFQRPVITSQQLEQKIRTQMSSRIVSVYTQMNKYGAVGYFDQKNKLGDAVLISSDGWLAMYKPNFNLSKNATYYIDSQDGDVYKSEKVVVDSYSGIVFIKTKGSQFKVVNFADNIKIDDELFVYQNSDWRYGVLGGKVQLDDLGSHLDSAPISVYNTSGLFEPGSVVINDQGRVAGFVARDNKIFPSQYLTRVMSGFLNSKTVKYPSLGASGWFSGEKSIVLKDKKVNGFLVTQVWSTKNLLHAGDVLLEVNGLVVNEDNLWYIISVNSKVKLKINRAGKILELEIPVQNKIIK